MEILKITGNDELFVLFHGTGGNEYSLLFLTGELNAQASIHSYLGNVSKNIYRRYFAPLEDGVLNREDYNARIDAFFDNWDFSLKEKFKKITFIGYSNGANFILGLLGRNPELANAFILLHPSNLGYTFTKESNIDIFMSVGASDPLVPAGDIMQLKQEMLPYFKNLEVKLLDGNHAVSDAEIDVIKKWYQNLEKNND